MLCPFKKIQNQTKVFRLIAHRKIGGYSDGITPALRKARTWLSCGVIWAKHREWLIFEFS
jgi:hypothetical protein